MTAKAGDIALKGLAIFTARVGTLSETFIQNQIQRIAPDRTLVCAFTPLENDASGDDFICIQPKHYRSKRRILRRWSTVRSAVLGSPYSFNRCDLARLEKKLKEKSTEVCLGEFGHNSAIMSRFCQKVGLPLVSHFHGSDASKALERWPIRRMVRILEKRSAAFICPSEFLKANLVGVGVAAEMIHVIPYGADISRFNTNAVKDENLAVAVGRFVEKKAPMLTIKAFLVAAEQNPLLRLEMIGDGPDFEACEKFVRDSEVGDRIRLLGAQSPSYVAEVVSRANYFLQHSVTSAAGETEGLPNTILEAMASGAVVVSTKHAGIPEAIRDGIDGCLVEERDWRGMGEALAVLSKNKNQVQQMRQSALARSHQEYSIDVQMRRLRQLLSRVCHD